MKPLPLTEMQWSRQQALASTPMDARVRVREGIKQRQVLVNAANLGECILADMDNTTLTT